MASGAEQSARAQAWARSLVQHEVLDEEKAKQAFFRYWDLLQAGQPQEPFPVFLVAQGIVPQDAVDRLARGISERMPKLGEEYQVTKTLVLSGGARSVPPAPPPIAAVPASPSAPGPAPPAPPGGGWGSAVQTNPIAEGPAPPNADLLPGADDPPPPPSDMTGTLVFQRVIPTPPDMGEAVPAGPAAGAEPPRLQSTCKEEESATSEMGFALIEDETTDREAEFFAEAAEEELQGPTRLPEVGESIDDYEVLEQVGSGAMGVIYKARHTQRGEEVALKVLTGTDRPGARKRRQRFQREVEALRRLEHENIVRVHTCGRANGLDWYVMDFVQGRELKEVLKAGELTPKERLLVFESMCQAVSHAHDRGVVHRDLKPANVLLEADGKVRVLDFGLAKLTHDDESDQLELTKSNATIGTPYYMSPEQFTDAKNVDWRADVYALGVLLFQLMCERRPFEGETAGELIKKVLREEPPVPSTLNPRLTPRFDQICLRALDKNRDQRYQQVEELRQAVANYRRGAFSGGGVSLLSDRARRWFELNRVAFLAGVAVATAFYLPLLFLMWLVS